MSALSFLNPPGLFLEIGQSSLKAVRGPRGLELPLERLENGRLSTLGKQKLVAGLRAFLKKSNGWPRQAALVAIGARGVSLRRLALPAAAKDDPARLLLLQLEKEFPLAPEELAWGSRPVEPPESPRADAPASREWLVAAIKREVLQDYADVLAECGLHPVFTLGALARALVCPDQPGAFAALDIGRHHSELTSFENGVPTAIRVLPWGGARLTQAIEKKLQVSPDEAEQLKLRCERDGAPKAPAGELPAREAVAAELAILAAMLPAQALGKKLYLTGATARLPSVVPRLAQTLGVACEGLEAPSAQGHSAAIRGLEQAAALNGDGGLLLLQLNRAKAAELRPEPMSWPWAALALVLALACCSLRYVEPWIQKPRLVKKLAQMKTYREQLPRLDHELAFLQYLQTNQPHYLEPMFLLAQAAPQGARFESLALNRRGDLSLRAGLRDAQQVAQFRTNLIASGAFPSLVVEEQTPTPDRQKVNVRIVGQWKSAPSAGATNELKATNAIPKTAIRK
jgi:Tfp pilus assembly PilM family ATPase